MTAKKKVSAKKTKTSKTPAKKAVRKAASKAKKSPATKAAAQTKNRKPAKKSAAKKTVPKKTPAKKASVKKAAVKKAAAKKVSAKKSAPSKKKPTSKKVTQKKVASARKKSVPKQEKGAGQKTGVAAAEVTRRVTEALRNKKSGSKPEEDEARKGQPVVFTMEDVREFLANRKTAPQEVEEPSKKTVAKGPATVTKTETTASPKVSARPKQSFGAASVADLLGFDPTADTGKDTANKSSEEGIPKKWITYFRALVALHEEVYEGLHRHSEETLRRSNKEDSGDLSSYGQHMADAGTDSFDRDFALSMVSSEQEALYEIDEAIRRIREGSYGVCEITGKSISRERLRAVPFTRYSVEGQMEVEKGKKRTVQKAGIQGFEGDDGPVLSDEDSDD